MRNVVSCAVCVVLTCVLLPAFPACSGDLQPIVEIAGRAGCTPVPEICGDGKDNDCDGVVDEPACVVCMPQDEVCNGVDDDCDGTVDEDCAQPVSMCTPAPEICDNGVDEDCDGFDASCVQTCSGVAPAAASTSLGGYPTPGWTDRLSAAWTGQALGVAWFSPGSSLLGGDGTIHLLRVAPDGTVLGETSTYPAPFAGATVTSLVWTGHDFVVFWVSSGTMSSMGRIDPQGAPVGDPVPVAGSYVRGVVVGGELGVLSTTGDVISATGDASTNIWFTRYDIGLTPLSPPLLVASGDALRDPHVAYGGDDTYGVVYISGTFLDNVNNKNAQVHLAIVHHGAVTADVAVPDAQSSDPAIAAAPAGWFLVCWQTYVGSANGYASHCGVYDTSGAPAGDVFEVAPPLDTDSGSPGYIQVAWLGCRFAINAGGLAGQAGSYHPEYYLATMAPPTGQPTSIPVDGHLGPVQGSVLVNDGTAVLHVWGNGPFDPFMSSLGQDLRFQRFDRTP